MNSGQLLQISTIKYFQVPRITIQRATPTESENRKTKGRLLLVKFDCSIVLNLEITTVPVTNVFAFQVNAFRQITIRYQYRPKCVTLQLQLSNITRIIMIVTGTEDRRENVRI